MGISFTETQAIPTLSTGLDPSIFVFVFIRSPPSCHHVQRYNPKDWKLREKGIYKYMFLEYFERSARNFLIIFTVGNLVWRELERKPICKVKGENGKVFEERLKLLADFIDSFLFLASELSDSNGGNAKFSYCSWSKTIWSNPYLNILFFCLN